VTRTITVDTHAPSVTINTIAGDDVISASEARVIIAVSGTAEGAEDGQLGHAGAQDPDGSTTLDTMTTTVSAACGTSTCRPGATPAFPDGHYLITADVSTRPAIRRRKATRAITVDTRCTRRPVDLPPSRPCRAR